jgi:hypothetical protein
VSALLSVADFLIQQHSTGRHPSGLLTELVEQFGEQGLELIARLYQEHCISFALTEAADD